MIVLNSLEELRKQEVVSYLEVEFIRFLLSIDENASEDVLWAAAQCIHAQRNGHICLALHKNDNEYVFDSELTGIKLNSELRKQWFDALSTSDLVGNGAELKPLVLQDDRLYIHRFWSYEEELTHWLKQRAEKDIELDEADHQLINDLLKPSSDLFETNWQHVAVLLSFLKDIVVISGGPGTGKTYTVLNIIAAQLKAHSGESFRLAMAAPTGKAARRLTESIAKGKKELKTDLSSLEIPETAFTVHKLLGSDHRSSHFRYNEDNKLPYDMIVIDEASMLDITLWVQLIRALGDHTKLIILGDKDQLASVEAGSILGDICAGTNSFSKAICEKISGSLGTSIQIDDSKPPINDCQVFLTKSYRFSKDSGIQYFAQAVNEGDAEKAIKVLKDPAYPDVNWLLPTEKNIKDVIDRYAVQHYEAYMAEPSDHRLQSSNKKKILCALRRGPFGVETFNQKAEYLIRENNQILNTKEWYEGRVIMATRNDAMLKIRNGEIGIYESGVEGGILFDQDKKHKIPAMRIKEYEPAFSITIHKSQGSEFEDAAIILSNQINSVLSKEILYTSVTRARLNTLIIASEEILRYTIGKSVSRNSGLSLKLWNS